MSLWGRRKDGRSYPKQGPRNTLKPKRIDDFDGFTQEELRDSYVALYRRIHDGTEGIVMGRELGEYSGHSLKALVAATYNDGLFNHRIPSSTLDEIIASDRLGK